MVEIVEAKLTITLSKKALDTLNVLTESSGFGSRGRVIEEAILAVDELTRLADQFLPVMAQLGQKPQTLEQTINFLSTVNSFMTYYVATLSRFRKPIRPQFLVSPPVTDAKAIGGSKSG